MRATAITTGGLLALGLALSGCGGSSAGDAYRECVAGEVARLVGGDPVYAAVKPPGLTSASFPAFEDVTVTEYDTGVMAFEANIEGVKWSCLVTLDGEVKSGWGE